LKGVWGINLCFHKFSPYLLSFFSPSWEGVRGWDFFLRILTLKSNPLPPSNPILSPDPSPKGKGNIKGSGITGAFQRKAIPKPLSKVVLQG